jgi:hypothetical protein
MPIVALRSSPGERRLEGGHAGDDLSVQLAHGERAERPCSA